MNAPTGNGDFCYLPSPPPPPPTSLNSSCSVRDRFQLDLCHSRCRAYWLLEIVCADQIETLTSHGKHQAFDHKACAWGGEFEPHASSLIFFKGLVSDNADAIFLIIRGQNLKFKTYPLLKNELFEKGFKIYVYSFLTLTPISIPFLIQSIIYRFSQG